MAPIKLTAGERISKAIIDLQKPYPFFAHLSMHMRIKEMPEHYPIRTCAVNRKGELLYAPEWIDTLTRQEVQGLIVHECLHLALLHVWTTGSRDAKVANICQDAVINSIVLGQGLSLPPGGIVPNQNDTVGIDTSEGRVIVKDVSKKIWEEIYDEIAPKTRGKNPKGQPDYFGDEEGDEEGGEEVTKRDQESMKQEWQKNLAEAANHAKQQGKLPSGVERLIDGLLKPQVTWKSVLLKYLRPHMNPTDWTYQKPHRKSQVLGVYMPGTLKEGCQVEILVDTSGSIGKEELKEFLSEIVGIAGAFPNVEMFVSFGDTRLHSRYKVENGDIPKILSFEAKGGGTDMIACLQEIKGKKEDVPVCVVLTDGYFSCNGSRADYPFDIIWCVTKNGTSKQLTFGDIVEMGK